jgi:hypothetical protein
LKRITCRSYCGLGSIRITFVAKSNSAKPVRIARIAPP